MVVAVVVLTTVELHDAWLKLKMHDVDTITDYQTSDI